MLIETLTKGTKVLEIHSDEDAENPRSFENTGTMVCFHKRYSLGDRHNLSSDEALRLSKKKGYTSLPLYLYDHSGLTISTTPFSCPWDSGLLGFIWVKNKDACSKHGWAKLTRTRREEIIKTLEAEVRLYDTYLRGDTFRFDTYEDGVLKDSCGGFYGTDHKESGLLEAACWED